MKKQLLLAGMVAIGMSAFAADGNDPKVIEDAYINAMSSNGVYAVSQTYSGVRIFNLQTGQEYTYLTDPDDWSSMGYTVGIGKCVSDNGIVLGGEDDAAQYWKDGEWYDLQIPENATTVNLSNAITPDGSRICGSIGVSEIDMDGDALMQVPCIWNATEDGYGMPVMLPHPDKDFTGRVPQYVTAVDISSDGKLVIGQVMDATGMISYPILYRENENGEWSYEIVHENFLMPEDTVFPEYPGGDGPQGPNYEEYMTPEELEAYDAAQTAFWNGETENFPNFADFMTEEEKAEYEKATAAYQEEYEAWSVKFYDWFDVFDKCMESCPNYEFNSIRISPDGKTYACTIKEEGEPDPEAWPPFGSVSYNVWVFDVNSDAITKYDQTDDLNLTYLANDGVALAATSVGTNNNSFVLSNGGCMTMLDWMSMKSPDYAAWMKENMTFTYEAWEEDPETGEFLPVDKEELMTGRPMSTPDLSVMILSVQNVWDYMTEADAFIFIEGGLGVNAVRPADGEKIIYDLSGRQLKNVSAPGIYIINGEKKVVR